MSQTATIAAVLATGTWQRATAMSIVEDVVLLDATGTVTPEFLASIRQLIGSPLPS